MAFDIRIATPADHGFIVACNLALARESEGVILDEATVTTGIGRLLGDPTLGRCHIAWVGAQRVGQVQLTWEWSDWRNALWWWIQSVYVVPEWRRHGVFRALYAHLHDAARDTPGVCGLRLYVDEKNHSAQAVYGALGMTTTGYRILEAPLRR